MADARRADRAQRAGPGPGRARPGRRAVDALAARSPRRRRTGSRRPRHCRRPTPARPTAAARGSLLLVNHWVDTSPAPRKTIAREVNAARSSAPAGGLPARRKPAAQHRRRRLLPRGRRVRTSSRSSDDPPDHPWPADLREECIAQAEPGRVADYIPELRTPTPSVRDRAGEPRRGRVRGRRRRPRRSRSSRSRSRSCTRSRSRSSASTTCPARVGVEPSGEPFNAISLEPEPGARQPAGQRGRDPHHVARRRAARADRRRACPPSRAARSRSTRPSTSPSTRPATATARSRTSCARRGRSTRRGRHDDVYFRQCSVLVTARDLAFMAATLANAGRNPVTGGASSARTTARHVLSRDGDVRHVRRRGTGCCASGCRRRAASSGGMLAVSPGQFGDRPLQPAARRARQQRARRARVRADVGALRPARLPRRHRRRPRGQGHRARRRARPARGHRLRGRRARAAAEPGRHAPPRSQRRDAPASGRETIARRDCRFRRSRLS